MIYFSVRLFIGKKHGMVARNSKNLLSNWNDAAFCESYEIAERIAERACKTAREIHPRAEISYLIQANKVLPARVEVVRAE